MSATKNNLNDKTRKSISSPRASNAASRLLAKLEKKVCFDEIGGLTKQIDLIKNIILSPIENEKKYSELGKYPPAGLLIYGLPGTGKTLVLNALMNELDKKVFFIKVDCKLLISKNAQEPEIKLKEIFDRATEQAPKSVLIFDDMEFIFPSKKKNLSETEKRLLLLLYDFFDSLIDKRRIVVIGITNNLEDVDPKLRRSKRFDYEIEFNVPLNEERIDILNCILKKCEHKINTFELNNFSQNLIAYTGSDIDTIISIASLNCIDKNKRFLTIDDLEKAALNVKPSAMREIKLEVPNVHWNDIGGMENVKSKLIESLIWPIKFKNIYDKFNEQQPKGVLMFGPPGCSKTMIGKALATECKHRFISIKGPEIFSKYVGDSEKTVREIFNKARQVSPSIIFFDEIDAIAVNRSSDVKSASSVNDKVVSTLLNELDGIEKLSNVFIVATTNRPDIIDKSLLRTGRLDSLIYVPLPNYETRKEIFRIKLSKIEYKMTENFNDELNILAEASEGFSGAELVTICHEAFVTALRLKQSKNEELSYLEFEDYYNQIKKSKPRTTINSVKYYEEFAEKFCNLEIN